MLALDSERWEQLTCCCGSIGARCVADLIVSLEQKPTERDSDEVFEQIAHQWTLDTSAYAALPHLLRLAVLHGKESDSEFLLNVGRVAAPIERIAPCPKDLQADFDTAIQQATALAMSAAERCEYTPREYVSVLQAAAALSGRRAPGIQLYFALGGLQPETGCDCPDCDAHLVEQFLSQGHAFIQAVDEQYNPVSDRVPVIPCQPRASDSDEESIDDFNWLAELCHQSDQQQVLDWISLLYGKARCPLCGTSFTVMEQAARSNSAGDGY